MKYGIILGLMILVLLSTTAFASFTIDINTMYAGSDHNYYKYPFDLNAVSDGSPDVNSDSICWFTSTGLPSIYAATWHTDTNTCSVTMNTVPTPSPDDDTYYMRISNGQRDFNYDTNTITVWLDENVPTVTNPQVQNPSSTFITITATDHATNTGLGAGWKSMKYMLDNSGTWYAGTNPNVLNYTSPTQPLGAHTVRYWVTDNLDNNTGIITVDFNIVGSAPVFTGRTTATREYIAAGDRNYYDFNVMWTSGIITDVDGDLNELSCEYSVNDGFTWGQTIPDSNFDPDTNRCNVDLNYEWGNTGWTQIRFRISDDTNLRTTTPDANWYLDNTAPNTVGTFDNVSVITLTATDSGTPAANGVGVKRIYYAIDTGAWTSVAASTATIPVTGVGAHHIYFYSTDNFDNNESRDSLGGTVWDKPFTVAGTSPGSPYCNLTMLMMLVLVAAAIVALLGLAYTGNLNIQTATAAAIALITFMIILVITGQVNAVMCA